MAPPIFNLVNKFYDRQLTSGPRAPKEGLVEVVFVGGKEAASGTSYQNVEEADAIQEWTVKNGVENTVILCPYAAQCKLVLAKKLGCPVHTIDSFQGREKDTVLISFVRDGTSGVGFWNEEKRIVVALSRARKKLVLFSSPNLNFSWLPRS